jgi:hypothetical protein
VPQLRLERELLDRFQGAVIENLRLAIRRDPKGYGSNPC